MGLAARWRSSERFQDGATAAGTFVAGLLLNLLGLTGIQFTPSLAAPAWWHTVFLAVGCLAMLGRRRHTMAAFGVGVGAVVADLAVGGSMGLVLVLFDVLYAVGLFAGARARAAVTTAVVVVIGTASVVGGLAEADLRFGIILGLQLVALLVIPMWWAGNLRHQRELNALSAEKAAREATHAERAAMARELHDVVAAHLSTTAIHSGAALALPPNAERDREALRAVRTSSLAALEEMRSMIMLLRPEQSGTVVPAGLDRADSLIAAGRAAGLTVTVAGAPPADLPALVDQAGYRIVREALTNAGKHAPGSTVRIEWGGDTDHLAVTVTNTLTGPGPGPGPLSGGAGLRGMAERAALLGGAVTAGRDGDRWRVHATLPLRAAATTGAAT